MRFDRCEACSLPGDALRMTYISPRRLADFCHGLIEASLDHYGETAHIERTDRSSGALGIVDFVIRRAAV